MKRSVLKAWVCVFALVVCAGAVAVRGDAPSFPAMVLTRAEVQRTGTDTCRLVLAAEGLDGARLTSFGVRVERRPPGPVEIPGYNLPGPPLPGFYRHHSRDGIHPVELEMLSNHPDGPGDSRLIDNGPLDEDPRRGVFVYTFNTKDWADGEYLFQVSASGSCPEGQSARRSRRFVGILVGDAEPAANRVNVADAVHRVIYKEDGIYAAFPRLHILPDGRMAISHSTRVFASHIDETGGSAHWATPDEGRSWQPLDVRLIDRNWINAEGHVVLPQSEGWIYVDAAREEELRAAGKRVHSRPTHDGRIAYMGGARVRTSTDGGRTWTHERIPMPEDPPRGLFSYSTAACVLVTESGVRMRAFQGSRPHPDNPDQSRPAEIYFARSEDDGKTWTLHPMIPQGLPGHHPGLSETALVQTPSGRVLAISRSRSAENLTSRDGYLWQSESDDDGLTWTMPRRTNVWGYPAHVIVLEDGRLLCAYGYRRDPVGIRAVLSHDEGRTWDVDNELILRADGMGHMGDNGMPLLHQLSDGSVIAIYYLTSWDGITHIASTTFTVP